MPDKFWNSQLFFSIFKWSASAWYPWAAYAGIILVTFSTIKVINYRLHLMFDTSESIEEQPKVTQSRRNEIPSAR